MIGKMKIYLGLLVLGLFMVVGGLWFLFNPLTVDNSAKLLGSQWKLVSINDSGLVEGTYISLYFRPEGRVWGYSGLNYYEGNYTANASAIRFEVGSTDLGHSNQSIVEQENIYEDCLWNAVSYSMDDNYLKIYGADNQLVFERRPEYRMDPADLAGTSWQLVALDGATITESQFATLIFDNNESSGRGTFRAYAGVYDYEFSYQAYGDDIIVTDDRVHRTEEIPRELRVDAGRYFTGMWVVGNYRLAADLLELYTSGGKTMTFKPVPLTDSSLSFPGRTSSERL
ncbi:MAG: META domain-containing protein [Dehalococcoidales bacterium]|nr:META domain-containing protein [Dehalococcoidales bacterium]